jgi:hypothetical protein
MSFSHCYSRASLYLLQLAKAAQLAVAEFNPVKKV